MADSLHQTDPLQTDRPGSGAELAGQIKQAAGGREKTRNLRPLVRLWPYIMRQKRDLGLMVLFLVVSSAATLSLTGATRFLIDSGFSSGNAAKLNFWFLVMGSVALLMAIATAFRYFYITKLGERVVADVREDLFAHILKLDPAHFLKIRTGEVISRLTSDIQIIETLVSSSISIALRNALGFVGGLILLMFVSPKLTLIVLAIFPFVLVPLITFGRSVGKLTRKTQDNFAGAVGLASESLDALETVQAFVRETSTQTRFEDSVEIAYQTSLKRMRARALMTAMVISLVFGGISVVLWLGAQDVFHNRMSTGALIQFVMLSVFTAGSVANLNETWGDLQKAAGAMMRIDELMRSQPGIIAPEKPLPLPEPSRGDIHFDAVSFAYPSRPDQMVLDGFSLSIRPGETVALVGPSG
ncbi:MAG: ABC transporter transmembrane domain-containing protein, partial [Asticcacaulis sp.]